MTAGLLTKGTRRHSATALARAAESLGGSLDSGAGADRSDVAITVSVPRLDAALALLGEAVQQPTFAQRELDRLRTQTLDDLKVGYSRPGTLATLAAQHLLFGNGAYGRPSGGTPASLPRIRRADLLAMHRLEIDRIETGEEVMAAVEIGHQRAFRLSSRRGGHALST